MPEYVYEEVSGGNYVSWTEPRTVEGFLKAVQRMSSKFGEKVKAIVTQDDGSDVWFYCPSMLERLAEIPAGSRVKIVFTGEYTKSKEGRPVKVFRLYVGRPKE